MIPSSLTPSNEEVLAHSPIPTGEATVSGATWGGSSYSDMVYFTNPTSKAGVIDTGNNIWIGDLRAVLERGTRTAPNRPSRASPTTSSCFSDRGRPACSNRICGRAGPVGLAAAHSAQLLGAAVVIVGDLNSERLAQARRFGCETVDVSVGDPQRPGGETFWACPRLTARSTRSASRLTVTEATRPTKRRPRC